MKTDLGISVGSLYHHLSKLKHHVAQNRSRRYVITDEGRNYLQSDLAELDIEIKAADTNTKSIDLILSTNKRRSILEYIAKNGIASIKEMRVLGMSIGSLYHHLYRLKEEGLITQASDKRYALTIKSFNMLRSNKEISPKYIDVHSSSDASQRPVETTAKRSRSIEEMMNHPKVKLVQYINEAGYVRIPDVRDHFDISKSAAKFRIKRMKEYLTTDHYGRYVLNDKGKSILDSIHDKETLEAFLYRKRKAKSFSRFTSPVPLRKHRSVYDVIAMILSSKDGIFYRNKIIRAAGITSRNTSSLLAYMETKGFIAPATKEFLPKQYAKSSAEFFKVTGRGNEYLKRYNSLVNIL